MVKVIKQKLPRKRSTKRNPVLDKSQELVRIIATLARTTDKIQELRTSNYDPSTKVDSLRRLENTRKELKSKALVLVTQIQVAVR